MHAWWREDATEGSDDGRRGTHVALASAPPALWVEPQRGLEASVSGEIEPLIASDCKGAV